MFFSFLFFSFFLFYLFSFFKLFLNFISVFLFLFFPLISFLFFLTFLDFIFHSHFSDFCPLFFFFLFFLFYFFFFFFSTLWWILLCWFILYLTLTNFQSVFASLLCFLCPWVYTEFSHLTCLTDRLNDADRKYRWRRNKISWNKWLEIGCFFPYLIFHFQL